MKLLADASKLLVDTQHKLIHCTNEILSQEYGTEWELLKNVVFDEQTRLRLEGRRDSRNGKITAGSKLIEFCNFLDLRNIIAEHSTLFFNIFPMWEKTLEVVDTLARFEEQMDDGFELDAASYQECVRDCAYLLKSLEDWENQSKVDMRFYYCDVSFDELEDGDMQSAKSNTLEQAKAWFEKTTAGYKVTTESSADMGTVYVLRDKGGTVKISDPFINRVYSLKGRIISARVRIMADSFPPFTHVLSKSGHSYSNICWVIKNPTNLDSMIGYADTVRGIEPYEEPNEFVQNFTSWGGQEYYLLKDGENSVRLSLSGIKEGLLRIKLVKDNSEFDNGFVKAHSYFSPQTLYAILLRLVSTKEIKSIVESSLKSHNGETANKLKQS